MTAIDMINQLHARGVLLKADGERLLYRPIEAVDPATLAELRRLKPELLAILKDCGGMEGFTPAPADVPDSPEPAPVEWTPEALDLIGWFQAHRADLPASPFVLRGHRADSEIPPTPHFGWRPAARVIDAERFYQSLDRDIQAGPSGPRARFGGLLADLDDLRRVVEKGQA